MDGKVGQFWRWFLANEWELYDEFDPALPLYHQFVTRIREVDRGLVADVGPVTNKKRELIMSADGKEGLFPLVMEIVDEAPQMDRWLISAFRPRRRGHLNVVFQGKRYETVDAFFEPTKRHDRFDIDVWFIDPEGLEDGHRVVAKVMLENLLGEYEFVKRVREIGVYRVDQSVKYPNLRPMVEISKWIEGAMGKN